MQITTMNFMCPPLLMAEMWEYSSFIIASTAKSQTRINTTIKITSKYVIYVFQSYYLLNNLIYGTLFC